ncbi:Phenylacetic acid catabolic protein [Siminovitchia sp. FSL H7-0308]|uniref:1,2-phenylacetyl-CoA epoxidase catalytic subunit n=1 Tax=Siminovitchia thermophila TaxID=1245522 RepID=A0ABS2RBI1_9BACI|nr:Phenylacetic acid catabolic protein [Siminovitchia thermophila]MBM7717023.1 1,2-phenylacetyl-CoA epoxidase catalytic subunit [Siminovitchia thermophila]ONK24595.1 phenylacetic acid catabolism protein [Bacillus sp. VT-16-64]
MGEQKQSAEEFIQLLEAIADNKYVLGDRLVEVGVSGPNLEATLAAIAMAQGELGHARLLYNWIFDLKGLKGKKPSIENQTGKAFHEVIKVQNWISLIAALYTVSTAVDIVLKAILETGNEKVISRIQKLVNEQKEHIIYSKQWAQQLLNDEGLIPVKFKDAINIVLPEVKQWLQSVEEKTEIAAKGYIVKSSSLYKKFEQELNSLPLRSPVAVN